MKQVVNQADAAFSATLPFSATSVRSALGSITSGRAGQWLEVRYIGWNVGNEGGVEKSTFSLKTHYL